MRRSVPQPGRHFCSAPFNLIILPRGSPLNVRAALTLLVSPTPCDFPWFLSLLFQNRGFCFVLVFSLCFLAPSDLMSARIALPVSLLRSDPALLPQKAEGSRTKLPTLGSTLESMQSILQGSRASGRRAPLESLHKDSHPLKMW